MLLKPSTLMVPTPIRDYPEWHLGRQNYALWYLEINDQKLVHYLDQLRAHFSEFLVEPSPSISCHSVYMWILDP